MNVRVLGLLLALGSTIALCGCARPFTRERYETVRVGDSEAQVRLVIGDPAERLYQQWFYDDLDRNYSAVIHFDREGKVRGKEWMDARKGIWEGRDPDSPSPPPEGTVIEKRTTTTIIDED